MCCAGSGRCDELVTPLEESYRVFVDCVLSGDLKMSGLERNLADASQKKTSKPFNNEILTNFTMLFQNDVVAHHF